MSGIGHLARWKGLRIWSLKTKRQVLLLSLPSCGEVPQQLSFLMVNEGKGQRLLNRGSLGIPQGHLGFRKWNGLNIQRKGMAMLKLVVITGGKNLINR